MTLQLALNILDASYCFYWLFSKAVDERQVGLFRDIMYCLKAVRSAVTNFGAGGGRVTQCYNCKVHLD